MQIVEFNLFSEEHFIEAKIATKHVAEPFKLLIIMYLIGVLLLILENIYGYYSLNYAPYFKKFTKVMTKNTYYTMQWRTCYFVTFLCLFMGRSLWPINEKVEDVLEG